jgi:hypothetical protein
MTMIRSAQESERASCSTEIDEERRGSVLLAGRNLERGVATGREHGLVTAAQPLLEALARRLFYMCT